MRKRDERGSALVELTWLGILLLIPLLWIILSVFEVQRGAFAVSGAARPALADQGVEDAPLDVRITCTPYPHDCHSGTSVITVVISSRVDLPLLPSFLGGNAPSFALDSTHTVPIGQFQEVQRAAP